MKRRYARYIVVVIAIILLLGAVIVYDVLFLLPDRQTEQFCLLNLSRIGKTVHLYAQEYGAFPASLKVLVDDFFELPRYCHCPFTGDWPDITYVYVTGLANTDPPDWPLAYDRGTNHPDGQRNVLFVSGNVELLDRSRFDALMARFHEEYKRARQKSPVVIGE